MDSRVDVRLVEIDLVVLFSYYSGSHAPYDQSSSLRMEITTNDLMVSYIMPVEMNSLKMLNTITE